MALSNLTIGTRLYLGFGVVVAILAIVIGVAYGNFARLSDANKLNIHTYDVIGEANGVLESLVNIETGERGFALTGKEASLEPLNGGKQGFADHLARLRALTSDNPAQQQRLAALQDSQRQWLSGAIEPVLALRRAVADGKENIDAVLAFEQAGKGKRDMDAMRALLAQVGEAERVLLAQRGSEAEALRSLTGTTLIAGGVTGAVLAALIALLLAKNITLPLAAAVALARRVAQGDLSSKIEVRSQDETGQLMQSLKDMNQALVGIVGQVRGGTDMIATASAEIAAGNMDLSSRTEQQASSLEETASSMEELTSTVKQNADNARQARQLALSASEVAVRGGAVVSQVVETMGSINESAHRIADIIGVIDGIAFQTNILALNAAVEAARAGEQGRGFAVVASEVRNLAQRSAGAAREIKALIDDSVGKVDAGGKLVQQAGATMNDVVDSVRRVSDIIGEITAASEEQRVGIEQVNEAITQMDQVTQQNAALVEQAAAAANAMQDQADALSGVVRVFRLEQGAAPQPALRLAQGRPGTVLPGAAARARPAARLVANGAAGDNDDWEQF